MFDKDCLKDILVYYKQDFASKWWKNEQYKWEAVKCFQNNWDINAENFYEMLHRSLEKTDNLLDSRNHLPMNMIETFASASSEDVRTMFVDLYDENKNIYERINEFKLQSKLLLKRYGKGGDKNHYQDENSISIYLWLRYPNKYYIYKYGIVDAVAKKLKSNYVFIKGAYENNIRNFLRLYDEINEEVKKDTELVELFKSQLTDTCYSDSELKTLTVDIGFYIYILKKYPNKETKEDNENSGSSKSNAVFLRWFRPLLQALKELGGTATPTEARNKIIENERLTEAEISETRGRNKVNKFENEVAFARSYLVYGGYIDKSVNGVWRLTNEGMTVDMTDELASQIFKDGVAAMRQKRAIDEKSPNGTEAAAVRYWLYAPGKNASMWKDFYNRGIMGLGWRELGDFKKYTSKEEIRDKLCELRGGESFYTNSANAVWQFVHDLKIGDVIFVKRGRSEIIGRGIVEGDYEYDENDKSGYPNIRKVKWTHKGNLKNSEQFAMKTLTDITDCTDFIEKVSLSFEEQNDDDSEPIYYPTYTQSDFFAEVYMTENKYNAIKNLLLNKKNIILQGAPGVGKTFAAKRLAWSVMGEKNEDRIAFVQFHQNYSYEDFVMGYKPVKNDFELKEGVFYRFCKKAEEQLDKEFFFIIDEINRGNLSKIFGELLMLIEKDYRGTEATLAYKEQPFSVPENLYIIGMMNTADRSLAMIDYALRRRFSFVEMEPAFNSEGFIDYQKRLNSATLDKLIERIKELNMAITEDKSLGKGFCIGHSYFCDHGNCTDERLRLIVEYDILPTLSEYWFDDADKLQRWTDILRGVFDD